MDEERVALLAVKAALYEVCTTVKPGLVDGAGNGAHRDMCIFDFVNGSLSMQPYFGACFRLGERWPGPPDQALFSHLRELGRDGERALFEATGGINTQKGLVFTLGILCCCLGVLERMRRPPECVRIREQVQLLCQGVAGELELAALKPQDTLSAGEKIYLKYGIRGIRGEAEQGFPVLFETAIPCLEEMLALYGQNTAFQHTLFHIMAVNEDTNLIARGGMQALKNTQKAARGILARLEQPDADINEIARRLDQEFVRDNLSPGGSADLLAAAIFINMVQKTFIKQERKLYGEI